MDEVRMRKRTVATLAALMLAGAGAAEAQVFTPTYQAPVRGGDVGIYLADDAVGDGLSVEGIYRMSMLRSDLGLRLGIAETSDRAGEDGTALLLGIDYRNPIELTGAAPLALAFTVGAQAAVADAEAFGAQAGLSVGSTFNTPGMAITPYIHPRIAFVDAGDDSDLEILADLGVDLAFNRNLIVRVGANLGDGADVGIGVAFRR